MSELYHHGVKGMKWGVRRTRKKSGSIRTSVGRLYAKAKNSISTKMETRREDKRSRKAENQEVTKRKSALKKPIRKMTDAELKSAIDRLKMEKEYKSLKGETINSGKKIASQVLTNIGTKSIENIGTQATTYAMGVLVNRIVGDSVVNPKKGQKDK